LSELSQVTITGTMIDVNVIPEETSDSLLGHFSMYPGTQHSSLHTQAISYSSDTPTGNSSCHLPVGILLILSQHMVLASIG